MINKINILLTGAGGSAAPFIINHLKNDNKYNIICVDANKNAIGFLLVKKYFVIPKADSKDFLNKIKKIVITESIQVIIPLVDEELEQLKNLEKKLKIICILPKINFIKNCNNKYLTSNKYLKTIKCDPYTRKLDLKILNSLTKNKLPCIIKPIFGRGSRDLFIIKKISDIDRYNIKKLDFNKFIIQKLIKGTEYTVSVVVSRNSKNLCVIPKKIIKKEGITKSAITKKNLFIDIVCKKIVDKFKPNGPFNVQCILDKFNNVYIFEINPRFSTSITLTISAGVDEINLLIDDALNLNKKIFKNIRWKNNYMLIRGYQDYFKNAK